MESTELTVKKREIFGKIVKKLRQQGLIPAELYGRGLENLHLTVSSKDLAKILKVVGENRVINLNINQQRRPVLIHNIQIDPISDEILNVDFYQICLDELIKVKVPVEFIGEAPAVKNKSGVLVRALQEIEIEALPNNIPQFIEVELNNLNKIGESLYVKDLKIKGDFKILIEPNTVIATVAVKVTEEEEATKAQEIDVSAIKTESEAKKKEKGEEEEIKQTEVEKTTKESKSSESGRGR